jgi:hypothetical protein
MRVDWPGEGRVVAFYDDASYEVVVGSARIRPFEELVSKYPVKRLSVAPVGSNLTTEVPDEGTISYLNEDILPKRVWAFLNGKLRPGGDLRIW